jgi:hypothetical protein
MPGVRSPSQRFVAAELRKRISHLPRIVRLPTNGGQSGGGQPHSKTLPRWTARLSFREVLECGCPLPLSPLLSRVAPFLSHMLILRLGSSVSPYVGGYA